MSRSTRIEQFSQSEESETPIEAPKKEFKATQIALANKRLTELKALGYDVTFEQIVGLKGAGYKSFVLNCPKIEDTE